MAVNKKYIIGIDIGGSKINAVLFDNGKVLKSEKITTPKNRKKLLGNLEKIILKIVPKNGKFFGIGCGVAGALDLKKGVILNTPNLRFLNNFNIKTWLEKKFNCKVKINNDARCFTYGEYLFGAGRGYKNIIGITLGTGVGGGIVINGRLFYGANGSAGEIGHMIIDNKKDLEFLTVKQMRKLKFSKIAAKKLEKNLGIGIASIINVLDPEAIIVGGGATKNAEVFIPKVKKIAEKFIISPIAEKNVKIIIGKLDENAGAIGAAALFMEHGT